MTGDKIEKGAEMQSTRQEILRILKAEGQATVEELARRLELTPMTIRHHLNVLQAQNLVVASKMHRVQKIGRPCLVYTLTETAAEMFPQSYGELARYLVSEVKETVGLQETRAIFRRMAERIAQGAPPWNEGQTFEERLQQVCDFLNGRGFLFRWAKTDEGYILTNTNCPYRQVAAQHGEVCLMDAILLEQLVGVCPTPLSSLGQGDRACTCLVVPPDTPPGR